MSAPHRSPDCDAMLERLSEYIDGELDEALCRRIEAHCAGCRPCVAFIEGLRRTAKLVAALESPGLSAEAKRALVAAHERARR